MIVKKVLNKIKVFEERTQDTGWINLTLQNNWTTSSSQNTPAYRKKNGVVYLRGLIYASADTTNRNFATLPTDCLPTGIKNNLYFCTSVNGNIMRNVQITKNGVLMAPGALEQGQWFQLEGISFPVE